MNSNHQFEFTFYKNTALSRFLNALKNVNRIGEVAACVRQSAQWRTLVPAFILRRNISYPYEFRTRRGERIRLSSWDDLTTVWHLFFGAEYLVPTDCKTILDLGANIGSFSVWATSRCPDARVYSLEPFPETFARLQESLKANGLEERVTPMQIAVAGHNGTGSFDATPDKRSYCRQLVPAGSDAETLTVECITLATLLDQLELPEVDCIKMDVEGGEYSIFEESTTETLRRAKIITMEFHDGDRAEVLWKKIESAGFEVSHKQTGGWSGLASYKRVD